VNIYEKLPYALSPLNYLKARYYRLIALRLKVNIYVLADNDVHNYRLIDQHHLSFEYPSIFVLHSNNVLFDALIPVQTAT